MSDSKDKPDSRPLLTDVDHRYSIDDVNASTRVLNYGTGEIKPRFTKQKMLVVGCVLMTELCERLTYYSVVANMILYCTSSLNMSSTDAARINLVFSG